MAATQWDLVSPVPTYGGEPDPIVRREHHPGSRVGLFSNRKHNSVVVAQEFARLLTAANLAQEARMYEKAGGPGVPAAKEELDRIAEECDVVVVGVAG